MLIGSTRYNTQTWNENIIFRERNDMSGCIYGSPKQLPAKIYPDTLLFVVEMNNSLNRIEGIGLIRNESKFDKYYCIYETGNYNRYVFKGNYRVDREILLEKNALLVENLELILFKGKTHLKRGSGITLIPDKLLKHKKCNDMNFHNEVKQLFKDLFPKKTE